ncbi:MAG TPA: YcxB family protein [Acidiferrobacterales bacterium]|jgi:hypothetical protein
MKFDVKFRLDRAYMGESYDQARRHGSKWLLGERIVGSALVVLGVVLLVYARGETVLPVVLVAVGVFELLSNRVKKHFWLRRHLKSKLYDVEIKITVSDSGIESRSPYSNNEMNWNGVEKVLRTPKGILIWPQKGMYWYSPESVAGADAIEFIESKIA